MGTRFVANQACGYLLHLLSRLPGGQEHHMFWERQIRQTLWI